MNYLIQFVAALVASVCFCVMFSVPKRQYFICGLLGGISWIIYYLLADASGVIIATFCAMAVIVLLARLLAPMRKCPVTILMIPGFIPLAPGSFIYYTAYYVVQKDFENVLHYGLLTLGVALAIVLAIIIIFALPIKPLAKRIAVLVKGKEKQKTDKTEE